MISNEAYSMLESEGLRQGYPPNSRGLRKFIKRSVKKIIKKLVRGGLLSD